MKIPTYKYRYFTDYIHDKYWQIINNKPYCVSCVSYARKANQEKYDKENNISSDKVKGKSILN